MEFLQWLFYHVSLADIFRALSFVGLGIYVIRRFILRRSPVPSSAFKKVPRELLQQCIALLEKKEKRVYGTYQVPEEILMRLKMNLRDEAVLRQLLDSVCAHLGINGEHIKLILEDAPMGDRAGEISASLAFTSIRLIMKPYYTVDAVIAVVAHEVIHLHMYFEGIYLKDRWENEILTDTAAVYCGFGEYIYRGYAVMRGEFAFSYQKVGYISQEDVRYLQELMEKGD